MTLLSAAEKLLQYLGVTEPEEIDVDAIAFDQGAKVKYRKLNSCEARIVGARDKAVITVDPSVNRMRQRFSVGHELGHWHHHRGRSSDCRPEDIGNPTRRNPSDPERVADGYAADLLLPRYIFEPMANDLSKTTFENVEKLATAFQTSITATAIRMSDYGPEPSMLVCHSQKGRKWFSKGRDVPNRWFPRDDLDPDSFAFDVLFGYERRGRRALIGGGAWFDRRDADRYELLEQSFQVVDGEVLTLLVFTDEKMLED